jgi:hypothetical protein
MQTSGPPTSLTSSQIQRSLVPYSSWSPYRHGPRAGTPKRTSHCCSGFLASKQFPPARNVGDRIPGITFSRKQLLSKAVELTAILWRRAPKVEWFEPDSDVPAPKIGSGILKKVITLTKEYQPLATSFRSSQQACNIGQWCRLGIPGVRLALVSTTPHSSPPHTELPHYPRASYALTTSGSMGLNGETPYSV